MAVSQRRRELPLTYPLVQINADKETSRIGTSADRMFELIGVDGSIEGGVRPFHGLKEIWTLSASDRASDGKDPLHNGTSRLLNAHPINFRIGANGYGFGVVYRMRRKSTADTTKADVFFDGWVSPSDSSSSDNRQMTFEGEKLITAASTTSQMDVAVANQYIYVFIEGQSPLLFYFDEADGSINTVANPGPGPRPFLASHDEWDGRLGDLDIPEKISRPAHGQMMLLPNKPSDNGVPYFGGGAWGSLTSGPQGAGGFEEPPPPVGVQPPTIQQVKTQLNLSGTDEDITIDDIEVAAGDIVVVFVASRTAPRPGKHTSVPSTDLSSEELDNEAEVRWVGGSGISSTELAAFNLLSRSDFIQDALVSSRYYRMEIHTLADPTVGGGSLSITKNRAERIVGATAYVVRGTDSTTPEVVYDSDADEGLASTITETVTGFDSDHRDSVLHLGATFIATNPVKTLSYVDGEPYDTETDDVKFSGGDSDPDNAYAMGGMHRTRYYPPETFQSTLGVAFNRNARSVMSEVILQPGAESSSFVTSTAPVSTSAGSSAGEGAGIDYDAEARQIERGDYVFGYVLEDTRTGRRSSFSEIAQVRAEDFTVRVTPNPDDSDDDGVRTARTLYAAIELVYDHSKFNRCYFYRSLKVQDAGGTKVAAVKHLDQIVDLPDYWTANNGPGRYYEPTQKWRQVIYYYRYEDKQIVQKDIWLDFEEYDEEMPYGGAAVWYDNMMVVSKIRSTPRSSFDEIRQPDSRRGVGEVRYGSTTGWSAECFPPNNRLVPNVPTNEPVAYRKVGPNLIGFAQDRMFHIRKEQYSLSPQEIHASYGIAGQFGHEIIGSLVYVVTSKGLKQVDSRGQLDDIRVANYVVVEDWVGQLENVSIAYDPYVGCLFVQNPDAEQCLCLWTSTGKFTELYDMNFQFAARGQWPKDHDDYTSTLRERALFFHQSWLDEDRPDLTAEAKHRVFVVDAEREKTFDPSVGSSGQRRVTLLDFNGDSRVDVTEWDVVAGKVSFGPESPFSIAGEAEKLRGAYMYVIKDASGTTLVDTLTKARILDIGRDHLFVHPDDVSKLSGLEAGDRVAFSPVYSRWTTPNVGLTSAQGTQGLGEVNVTDFHSVKRVDGVRVAFATVTGLPLTEDSVDAKFWGLLFKGDDADPAERTAPVDEAGDDVRSIYDNKTSRYIAAFGRGASEGRYGREGTSFSVGVEIVCPDLEFVAAAMRVDAMITADQDEDAR